MITVHFGYHFGWVLMTGNSTLKGTPSLARSISGAVLLGFFYGPFRVHFGCRNREKTRFGPRNDPETSTQALARSISGPFRPPGQPPPVGNSTRNGRNATRHAPAPNLLGSSAFFDLPTQRHKLATDLPVAQTCQACTHSRRQQPALSQQQGSTVAALVARL